MSGWKKLAAASSGEAPHNHYYVTTYSTAPRVTVFDYKDNTDHTSKVPSGWTGTSPGFCAISPNGQYIAVNFSGTIKLCDTFNLTSGDFTDITVSGTGYQSARYTPLGFSQDSTKLFIPGNATNNHRIINCSDGSVDSTLSATNASIIQGFDQHPTDSDKFLITDNSGSKEIYQVSWTNGSFTTLALPSGSGGSNVNDVCYNQAADEIWFTMNLDNWVYRCDFSGSALSNLRQYKPFDGSDSTKRYMIGEIYDDKYIHVNQVQSSFVGSLPSTLSTSWSEEYRPVRYDFYDPDTSPYMYSAHSNKIGRSYDAVDNYRARTNVVSEAGAMVQYSYDARSGGTGDALCCAFAMNASPANVVSNAVPDVIGCDLSNAGFAGRWSNQVVDVYANLKMKGYTEGTNVLDQQIQGHGWSLKQIGQKGLSACFQLNAGGDGDTGYGAISDLSDPANNFWSVDTGGNWSHYMCQVDYGTNNANAYTWWATGSSAQSKILNADGTTKYNIPSTWHFYRYGYPSWSGRYLAIDRNGTYNIGVYDYDNNLVYSTGSNTTQALFGGNVKGSDDQYILMGSSQSEWELNVINGATRSVQVLNNYGFNAFGHSTKDHLAANYGLVSDGTSYTNAAIHVLDWSDAKSGTATVLYNISSTVGYTTGSGVYPGYIRILGYTSNGDYLYVARVDVSNPDDSTLYKLETTNYTLDDSWVLGSYYNYYYTRSIVQ